MWVSRRTDYATRAALALALADGGPKLDELTETTEAPRSVLEQVMPVHGRRGSSARPAAPRAATG